MLTKTGFLAVMTCLSMAHANEDAHGGGHEEAKEASGHEAAAAPKVEVAPWVEVESRISALEAKVKAKEMNLEKLLEEKHHLDAKDPKMKEIVSELSKEHREMRAAAEDLDKQRTILRYRFPERGADPKRKYEKVQVRSLKDMEANIGVDGRLQKAYQRAEQQYGKSKPVEKQEAEAKPRSSKKQEAGTFDAGSLILQK